MSKGKAYFMYKSLSCDLFTALPHLTLDGIETWSAAKVGELRQQLYIGYERNSRCAELRKYYRDTFIEESLRDEPHEIAIREAERCALFYDTQLIELGRKLATVPDERESTDPVSASPNLGAPRPKAVKRKTRKSRGSGPPTDTKSTDRNGDPMDALLSLPHDEAYRRAEALYDSVTEKVRVAAKEYVETIPEMLLSTLVHCVMSMYARKSRSSGALSAEWFQQALLRMQKASEAELR